MTIYDTPADRSAGPIPQYYDESGNLLNAQRNAPFPVTDYGLPKDSFNRVQVADPVSLFDSQSQYDAVPLLWETTLAGGATETHNANESTVDLNVTTANGDKATRQTRQYFRYQPGKSQLVIITVNFGAGQANTVKRVGYFDDDNGFYIKEEAGAVSIVKRSKVTGTVVETEVAQSAWNQDPADGTGDSGVTLNPALSQIWFITAEWLGVGSVTVGMFYDKQPIALQTFHHANRAGTTATYTTTHNLPVRYEIENEALAASTSELKTICCSVISEGGLEDDRGYPFSASNGTTTVNVTTRRPILSIRPKTSFNSVVNRSQIITNTVNTIAFGNGAFIEIVYNGALTGASFASVNASSTCERDVDATGITGGIVIDSFFVGGNAAARGGPGTTGNGLQSKLPLTLDKAGANPINLSVVATGYSATASCAASLFWTEFR